MITVYIGEYRCIIQAYKENDFVNICPMLTFQQEKKHPYSIPTTKIYLDGRKEKFFTSGKESNDWRNFLQLIDLEEITKEIQKYNL
jgi:hypothetical protein